MVKDKPVKYLNELQQNVDQKRAGIDKKPFHHDDDSDPGASSGKEHEIKKKHYRSRF